MLIKTCRSHWLCIQTPGQQGCGVWKQFNNFLYSFTGKNVFRAKGPPRWTQQNCYISTWIFSNQIQLELSKLNFKLLTLSLSHRDLAIYFKLHSSKWFFSQVVDTGITGFRSRSSDQIIMTDFLQRNNLFFIYSLSPFLYPLHFY